MSAPGSEPPSTEGNLTAQDEKGASPNVPFSAPPASIPSPAPPFPTTAKPNSSIEAVTQGKAVSVSSNECCSAVSSPAEASPAKPAETTTSGDAAQTSTPTSQMASASDSLVCTGTSLVSTPEPPPSLLPSSEFGGLDSEKDYPRVLTFRGVSVTLENHNVWKKFHSNDTEMILTKPGRRMFPYCRYRLSGLDPKQKYSLVLSIVPWDQYRYRWNKNQWEVSGPAEHQIQGLIRMFPHDDSPSPGSKWMSNLVSFYKLKLTNNFHDRDGHIILTSMHRYIPRLHVISFPDGNGPTADQPVIVGPESMTFTFPQTKFMAVTTYQNLRITQLKIYFNPFARGFREDGNNPRLVRVSRELETVKRDNLEAPDDKPVEMTTDEETPMDLSMKSGDGSHSNVQETQLVPIMSHPARKDEPYAPRMPGRCALGELVLVEKSPPVEQKEGDGAVVANPKQRRNSGTSTSPKATSKTPASGTSAPETSPGNCKRKKKIIRRWANIQLRGYKASPAAAHNSSAAASMEPETDDVEGLLFVSFTSKEALEVHLKDRPAVSTPQEIPGSPAAVARLKETTEAKPETDGDKIARLEPILLNDLRVLRHRQVIHPVLQEVGLKLSSLDPAKSIDLQYLGVTLPLPLPNSSGENLSAQKRLLPFISRTGKTSDMTKIKGWKTKFMTSSKSSSSNCVEFQRNLSAFCSNMLDEYLESEAQQITERADAFSTNPEGPVAYQLPAKSASYVKTLDSALKHRNAASKSPPKANRPCPLSHKPLLYSALTAPPPSLDAPPNTGMEGAAWFKPNAEPSHTGPAPESPSTVGGCLQRSSTSSSAVSGKPSTSSTLSRRMPVLPSGSTLIRHRLLVMEGEAVNQGLSRTNMTLERQSVALSVLVTRETKPGRLSKVPLKKLPLGSKCVKAHCRLGCVCPSKDGGPVHCRKPECMFECSCITSQQAAQQGSGPHNNPVSPVAAVEHVVQSHPNSRIKSLWNHSNQDEDPEPLFIPKTSTDIQDCGMSLPQAQPIQQQEKDPVYRYLESFMTCARVREFVPKTPHLVDPQPQIDPFCEPNSRCPTQEKNTTDPQAEDGDGTQPALTKQDVKASQRNSSNEKDPKTQIQIQSLCPWQKDRKVILEALCTRMSQNRLSRRFSVGPYCINPIDRLRVQKPSGSITTYRLQIGLRSNDSDGDGDDADCEDEFAVSEEGEDDRVDVPRRFFGVTPFLSGLLPAGKMRVRRKSPMNQQGLVQVNGKCYNHAKLMLGTVGALHPANRLAAFVTGRLKGLKKSQKISQKPESKPQPTALSGLPNAGSRVSPAVPERLTSDLKTQMQPQGQLIEPDVSKKESTPSGQDSEAQSFVSILQHSPSPLQGDATSSHVVLTVSPSLLNPSFLEQSGTYSFRICPSSQSTGAPKLPGVSLPGGFTLIQLPKHGAEVAARQPAPLNAADQAGVNGTPQLSNKFCQFASAWLSEKTQDRIRSMLSGDSMPGPSARGGDGEDHGPAESPTSCNSSDLTSDSSDYSDCEENGELVDVETVEETQFKAIDEMKQIAARNCERSKLKPPVETRRRRNHTVVERARRLEQSELFNKLCRVLRSDPRTVRLTLLERAVDEIKNLTRVSNLLENKKRTLTERQRVCLQKLSSLSGKSTSQIKSKLTEIYARQKIEKTSNGRFFSSLLQSRAARLESPASQSSSKPPHHVVPAIPAHSNTHKKLFLLRPHLYKTLTDSSGNTNVPESIEPGEVVDPPHVTERQVKLDDASEPSRATLGRVTVAETLKRLRSQPDEAPDPSSASSVKSKQNSQQSPSQPFNLPLIRSKTGRIILPSCLKPLGNGYYTLVGMISKDEEGGVASVQTGAQRSDAHQIIKQEDTQTVSHLYIKGQCNSISEDTPPSLDLDAKPSAPNEPDALDQKPLAPSTDMDSHPKSEALRTDADGREIIASTRLTFNPLPENVKIPIECSVGRPAKHTAGTTTGCSPQPKRPKKTEKNVEARNDVPETPVLAKRRGRPPKGGSEAKRGVGRPPKPKQDDPGCPVHRFRSHQASGGGLAASRPLTRGALGKDFPSAKKRSWIDIEKELESDEESE